MNDITIGPPPFTRPQQAKQPLFTRMEVEEDMIRKGEAELRDQCPDQLGLGECKYVNMVAFSACLCCLGIPVMLVLS